MRLLATDLILFIMVVLGCAGVVLGLCEGCAGVVHRGRAHPVQSTAAELLLLLVCWLLVTFCCVTDVVILVFKTCVLNFVLVNFI